MGLAIVGLFWMIAGFFLLCLPGAILGVVFFEMVDLNQPTTAMLFKGFSVGSVTFFTLFVYRLSKGLRGNVLGKVATKKFLLRCIFACGIAAFSLSDYSIFGILLVAIPIAIFIEFQTWI
jgi:hypothetical protein